MRKLFYLLAAFALSMPVGASAQTSPININLGEDMFAPERLFQLIILLTVLSLAPSILVMMTSFTRIVVVFSFLRSAMGLQSSPPNSVLISLALFMTGFIMMPTLQASYENGIRPYLDEDLNEEEAFESTLKPFKTFMLAQVNPQDLELFVSLLPENKEREEANEASQLRLRGIENAQESKQAVPIQALIPAFMISELRRAFEIGFLIFLPFLVIDLTVASILMSMGMMMLPPVLISLPFKVIFFVLIDGWHLLVGSLLESFNTAY